MPTEEREREIRRRINQIKYSPDSAFWNNAKPGWKEQREEVNRLYAELYPEPKKKRRA